MKKIDGFFVTILILVTTLVAIYYYAQSTMSYFDNNLELKTRYERIKNLNRIEQKLAQIAKADQLAGKQRNIASLPPVIKSGEIVFENSSNQNEMAKKYYLKAKSKCYELNKEFECLRTIEKAVTHFPESEWTGESLVLLTDFYFRTKRIREARETLRILKEDFKNSKSIQKKVVVIERHLI